MNFYDEGADLRRRYCNFCGEELDEEAEDWRRVAECTDEHNRCEGRAEAMDARCPSTKPGPCPFVEEIGKTVRQEVFWGHRTRMLNAAAWAVVRGAATDGHE